MSKVKEFVDIVKGLAEELDVEIKEIPVEWPSTIFINQNPKGQTAVGGESKETKEVTGQLESKGLKKVNGKDLYHVKIDGQFYNTFSKDAFGGRKFQEGETVKAKVQKNSKGYWNLLELVSLDDQEPQDIPF